MGERSHGVLLWACRRGHLSQCHSRQFIMLCVPEFNKSVGNKRRTCASTPPQDAKTPARGREPMGQEASNPESKTGRLTAPPSLFPTWVLVFRKYRPLSFVRKTTSTSSGRASASRLLSMMTCTWLKRSVSSSLLLISFVLRSTLSNVAVSSSCDWRKGSMMDPKKDSRVLAAPRTRTDAMFKGVERFSLTYCRSVVL